LNEVLLFKEKPNQFAFTIIWIKVKSTNGFWGQRMWCNYKEIIWNTRNKWIGQSRVFRLCLLLIPVFFVGGGSQGSSHFRISIQLRMFSLAAEHSTKNDFLYRMSRFIYSAAVASRLFSVCIVISQRSRHQSSIIVINEYSALLRYTYLNVDSAGSWSVIARVVEDYPTRSQNW
jgi:hypothetical protein